MYTFPRASFPLALFNSDAMGVERLRDQTNYEIQKAKRYNYSPQQLKILKARLSELDQDDELRVRMQDFQKEYERKHEKLLEEVFSKIVLTEESFAIPEATWKEMIELCCFGNFSKINSNSIYDKLMDFIQKIDVRSKHFMKSQPQKVTSITSSITLILQKCNDNFKKYFPLLVTLLKQESFTADSNKSFTLYKKDFSFYFSLDFIIKRILVSFFCKQNCAFFTKFFVLISENY